MFSPGMHAVVLERLTVIPLTIKDNIQQNDTNP